MLKQIFITVIGLCITGMVNGQVVLPLDPEVKKGELSNGFQYYIRKNQEPKNRVMLYLALKAGSILETNREQGLAHFMEHMSFNGTKNFPKNDLINYLQRSGVRFGADLNAFTSFDETVYQLPLPSDKPSLLDSGFLIMRDWAGNAVLEQEEIDKERGVVLEEKRLRLGSGQRMQNQYLPVLFNYSRYANRLPIGTEEVLNNFTREDIQGFYKKWYRPNLQALIVVGDIDPEIIEQKIKLLFGDLKNPTNAPVRTAYSVSLTGKKQFIALTDPELTNTSLQIMKKYKALVVRTDVDYRSMVLRSLINQMLSARLAVLSRIPNSPFLQASALLTGFMGGLDMSTVAIVPRPGQTEKAFNVIWQEIERLKKWGFTQAELDREKKSYERRITTRLDEKDKTPSSSYMNAYQSHFLKGTAAPGIQQEYDLTMKILKNLTIKELNQMAVDAFSGRDEDVLVMAPEKEKASLPDSASIQKWIKKAGSQHLTAWVEESRDSSLIQDLPSAGKIVAKNYQHQLGTTEIILSNGMKVILKPTQFKNDEIIFTGVSKGGASMYNDGDYFSASNAASIIASGGVGNFNRNQLSAFLAGKKVGVTPFINDRNEGVSGSASPKDLGTALQLVYLYFTKPRKDNDVFQNIITRFKDNIASRLKDPANVFSDTVTAFLGNYSPRRTTATVEKIDQLSLSKIFDIYGERFANAGDFTFVFTGNIDSVAILPLLEKYLASLPSTGVKEEAKDWGIQIPQGRWVKTVNMGKEDKALVQMVVSGNFEWSNLNNLQLQALKQLLLYRLTERLREQEGGVYTPQVSVNYSKYPAARYSFTVNFGCAPANVAKLIQATKEEMEQLGKTGPTQEDLSKFKAEEKRQLELQLQSNNYWHQYLMNAHLLDEDPATITTQATLLDQLTTEHLQAMAAKLLNNGNFISFELLPEKK